MNIKDFVKPSKAIKEIKFNWNKRLKQHQAEGYTKQECMNLKQDSTKYDILEYLKKQNRPFVIAEEVSAFMNNAVESTEKNKRLMLNKVKYARIYETNCSCISVKTRLQKLVQ